MQDSRSLPPVIVLGIDSPIGLTVVRELGERGVAVHGIAHSPRGLGLYSRWLHQGYVQPRNEVLMTELLARIGKNAGAAFVMTVSMRDALMVRRASEAGVLGGLRPLLPPLPQLETVNDKAVVCALARQLGISTPYTWEPRSDDIDGPFPERLTFPCVLKWSDPDRVAPELFRQGLRMEKFRYVYSIGELRDALSRFRLLGQFPLVQSFSPGVGLGQMFLMYEGQAVLRFQHRRIAEWPPEGGFSAVCESMGLDQHAALMRQSEYLLRQIGWCGPAMVEYRFDPASGKADLMEINGRFWGSLPLSYHAGARFGWATYATLGLGNAGLVDGMSHAGVRCRYAVPETKRLFRIVFRGKLIQNRALRFCRACEIVSYVAAYFRPRTHYFVFTFRDPKPFLVDLAFMARIAVGAVVRRAAKGGRGTRVRGT